MRVVCVSDTHSLHHALRGAVPDGDVLVHAGDFTDVGAPDEVAAFNTFLGELPHRHKIVIAGNHETTFDREFYRECSWWSYRHTQHHDPDEVRALLTNAIYLEDEAVVIDGFKFYGSPWQPEFCNWAFNLPRRSEALRAKWRLIPSDTDVLVTHGPPYGVGDEVAPGNHQGCEELAREVIERVRPQLHVFGHIHEGHGVAKCGATMFANASICSVEMQPTNSALVFDLVTPRA